jgi:DNA-directed RNA polymerase II subunit RPB9
MLYPKEDKVNNQLMFACRTCQFSEPAPSACVFRNQLYTDVSETAGVTQDVGSDPTVGCPEQDFDPPICTLCGETIKCVLCGENECTGMICATMADRTHNDDGELAGGEQQER